MFDLKKWIEVLEKELRAGDYYGKKELLTVLFAAGQTAIVDDPVLSESWVDNHRNENGVYCFKQLLAAQRYTLDEFTIAHARLQQIQDIRRDRSRVAYSIRNISAVRDMKNYTIKELDNYILFKLEHADIAYPKPKVALAAGEEFVLLALGLGFTEPVLSEDAQKALADLKCQLESFLEQPCYAGNEDPLYRNFLEKWKTGYFPEIICLAGWQLITQMTEGDYKNKAFKQFIVSMEELVFMKLLSNNGNSMAINRLFKNLLTVLRPTYEMMPIRQINDIMKPVIVDILTKHRGQIVSPEMLLKELQERANQDPEIQMILNDQKKFAVFKSRFLGSDEIASEQAPYLALPIPPENENAFPVLSMEEMKDSSERLITAMAKFGKIFSETECPISRENLTDIGWNNLVIIAGHPIEEQRYKAYDGDSLRTWLRTKGECPLSREKLSNLNRIQLVMDFIGPFIVATMGYFELLHAPSGGMFSEAAFQDSEMQKFGTFLTSCLLFPFPVTQTAYAAMIAEPQNLSAFENIYKNLYNCYTPFLHALQNLQRLAKDENCSVLNVRRTLLSSEDRNQLKFYEEWQIKQYCEVLLPAKSNAYFQYEKNIKKTQQEAECTQKRHRRASERALILEKEKKKYIAIETEKQEKKLNEASVTLRTQMEERQRTDEIKRKEYYKQAEQARLAEARARAQELSRQQNSFLSAFNNVNNNPNPNRNQQQQQPPVLAQRQSQVPRQANDEPLAERDFERLLNVELQGGYSNQQIHAFNQYLATLKVDHPTDPHPDYKLDLSHSVRRQSYVKNAGINRIYQEIYLGWFKGYVESQLIRNRRPC